MSEEQNLPALFDKRGAWLGYSDDVLSQLSPERAALYRDLEAAALANVAAEQELKTATDHVADCIVRVRDAEAAMPKPMTHHELWQQHFGRPRHVNER